MPAKIISRELINKNIELYIGGTDVVYRYNDIIRYINRIKTFLIKELEAKPGQSIMLLHGDIHVPWLYACAELGLQLVIAMHPMFKNTKLESDARELYGTVDYLVKDLQTECQIGYDFSNPIDINSVEEYDDESHADTFYSTPDTILTKSISETARQIKIEYHKHSFFYELLERNAKLFSINATDRCLHNKMLHHGPVFGEFFLPSIKYATTHVWYTHDDDKTFDYLFQYNINRVTFLYFRCDQFETYVRFRAHVQNPNYLEV